ncbi:putative RNA polymerase III 80 kDa subunit RPC5 [Operophtera brumata]|uniref:Putative RNA polymerase III 80 kDa subunit RPC5 n=1 Tax=Operophtera brumata TaxID=104452 RepID=A0A0L7K3D5_OPEBR|nr:putative RNA polymerase III 80 kDa subunit RPC5 [Operophtera brumata]
MFLFQVDVFLSKALANNLVVLQYPVRPGNRDWNDIKIKNAAIKPKNQMFRLEVALDTYSDKYCPSKGEQIAVNTDGQQESTWHVKEKDKSLYFKQGMMDKIVLESSAPCIDTKKYAVAILQDKELHITPIQVHKGGGAAAVTGRREGPRRTYCLLRAHLLGGARLRAERGRVLRAGAVDPALRGALHAPGGGAAAVTGRREGPRRTYCLLRAHLLGGARLRAERGRVLRAGAVVPALRGALHAPGGGAAAVTGRREGPRRTYSLLRAHLLGGARLRAERGRVLRAGAVDPALRGALHAPGGGAAAVTGRREGPRRTYSLLRD